MSVGVPICCILPSLDVYKRQAFHQLAVFLSVNLLHLVGTLFACHFLVEVGTFDVQSQYGLSLIHIYWGVPCG